MSILSDAQLQRYRLPLLAIACLQAFFTSGIFYGWASLYTLFLDAGVYSELCEQPGEICAEQKERLTFIYTVASSVNLCSQLPWGLVLDFLGPRVCNMWSTSLVITGFVLLSLSARGVMDAFLVAMCLIGGAGPGAQISLFHLSELFPPLQKSTVLSVVTGAFQLGFVVFLLWHEAFLSPTLHLSVASLAMLYCIPLAALLLLGGVLWPDAPCIPPDDFDPLSFTSRRPSIAQQEAAAAAATSAAAMEAEEEEEEGLIGKEIAPAPRGVAQARSILVEKKDEAEPEMRMEGHGDAAGVSAKAPGGGGRRVKRVQVAGEASPSQPLLSEEQPQARNAIVGPSIEDEQQQVSEEGVRSPTPPQEEEVHALASPVLPPPPLLHGRPAVAGGDYGSLPDPRSSPSLHYVHRSLHALKSSRSNPNLKGMTASNPFMAQLLSPSFLLCLLWMSICLFWANFYIGTAVEQLYVKSHFDVAATRHYTSLFTLLLPVGVLGIGVFGYLTDVLGFSASIGCTSLFAVGFAACALWGSLSLQPLTFVLYSFFRSFLFSCMFAYLANEFGYRHFGLLSGIMLATGGALGLLQYPLVRKLVVKDGQQAGAAEEEDEEGPINSSFRLVNQLQLYTLMATFFFAIYVYIKQRMRSHRIEQQIKQHTRHLETIY